MKKILVIEDDSMIRGRIVDTLELEDDGYTVFSAVNGREGVTLAKQEMPDLVITDIMMPLLDGYGVLAELRAFAPTALTPCIFLSAKADHDHIRAGMTLGADDYLAKPFSVTELLQSVRTQISKRESQKVQAEARISTMRSQLSASLPHEFRTPLSSILGFAELLREYQNLQPDEVFMAVEQIRTNAHRLQRLSENFLMYAQVEMFMDDAQRRNELGNAITVLAEDAIERTVNTKAEEYQRPSDVQVNLEAVTLAITPPHLLKIIEELLDNALKFSKPNSAISVRGIKHESQYELIIADHGRGMIPEQIASIGAYMQFDRKAYEQQGAGLGLILVKRLVEIYNGTFAIRAEDGAGATVTVVVPLAKAG
jgi:two-component system, sensor histidine kinase and response regulator